MDEEEKKMRKLAAEADDKEESYYRKAMERKAEQSRVAQLQAPPKRGKKPPVSEKAVEAAVKKRKAAASKFPRGVEIDEDELEAREFRKNQERAREIGGAFSTIADYEEEEYKRKQHRKENPVPKLSQTEEDLVEQYDNLSLRTGKHRLGTHNLYYMWQEGAEWEKSKGRGDIMGDGNTFESFLKTRLKYLLQEAFPAGSDFKERPKFTLMRDLAKGHKGVPDDPTIDQKTGLAKPVAPPPPTSPNPSRLWLIKEGLVKDNTELAIPDYPDPEKKVPLL